MPLRPVGENKGKKGNTVKGKNRKPLPRTPLIRTEVTTRGSPNGQTAPNKLTLAEKRQAAFDLRIQGHSLKDIARALDVSIKWVGNEVFQVLTEINDATYKSAEIYRTMELERLDQMLIAQWPNRYSHKAAPVILDILKQRHKLLGLETVRHLHGGLNGGPIPLVTMSNIDLTKLSEEELGWLEVIVQKAGPVGALLPSQQPLPAIEGQCHEIKS